MLRYLSNLFLFPPLDHIVQKKNPSVKVSHVSYRSCFDGRLLSIKLSFTGWVLGFSATGQSRSQGYYGRGGIFFLREIP